jgi:hypothetical protein
VIGGIGECECLREGRPDPRFGADQVKFPAIHPPMPPRPGPRWHQVAVERASPLVHLDTLSLGLWGVCVASGNAGDFVASLSQGPVGDCQALWPRHRLLSLAETVDCRAHILLIGEVPTVKQGF